MAFYGESFNFNNISSERYNLKITTPKSDETINVSDYSSNLIKTPRRSKFYATKQIVDKPLVIPISIYSETPLTRSQIDQIENWLFNTDGEFKKLRINQEDMKGYYYNCRLQKMEAETFGNMIYQINCLLEMDSIYAWQNQQTRVYTNFINPISFVNISSENVMRPIYTIKCNSPNGIINILDDFYDTDIENAMEFKELLNGEILTIDTEHNIITSNLRTIGVLNLFTYPNFLGLKRGKHNFTITGNISEFKITYSNARKVGG